MQNTGYFKNKKITVVGIARSGFAAACLLHELGAIVSVTDKGNNTQIREYAKRLRAKNILVELGSHSEEFIKGKELIIASPGVSGQSDPLVWAKDARIPIISEIELAWILCPATVIAVTGTNGKTTVTTLIGEVLRAGGENVYVCGNIGNPFSGQVGLMVSSDFVSLEVSSFQLETIDKFKPKISVILNFGRNHLDRHNDMQEYLESKKRIFMNQDDSDYLVLNYSDPIVRNLSKETKAKVIYFNRSDDLNPNYAPVMAVSQILNIDKNVCLDVLRNFRGVEHRFEYIGQLDGVDFINDSKATTVDSTIFALNSINRGVILIAGGRDKGMDFTALRSVIVNKVKILVLIGEAKDKIKNALLDIVKIQEADDLKAALCTAWSQAATGDVILFSPMCASFDMFSNFEERGMLFKELVRRLIEAKPNTATRAST